MFSTYIKNLENARAQKGILKMVSCKLCRSKKRDMRSKNLKNCILQNRISNSKAIKLSARFRIKIVIV
jgi:predicted metal-binding protein